MLVSAVRRVWCSRRAASLVGCQKQRPVFPCHLLRHHGRTHHVLAFPAIARSFTFDTAWLKWRIQTGSSNYFLCVLESLKKKYCSIHNMRNDSLYSSISCRYIQVMYPFAWASTWQGLWKSRAAGAIVKNMERKVLASIRASAKCRGRRLLERASSNYTSWYWMTNKGIGSGWARTEALSGASLNALIHQIVLHSCFPGHQGYRGVGRVPSAIDAP
jgi:hypothetical protein